MADKVLADEVNRPDSPTERDIPQDLHDYVVNEILPQYDHFDAAHHRDHAESVIAESLRLAQFYPVQPAMVYAIAACHDIGLCEGREHHHEVSARLIRNDQRLRQWFSEEEIQTMAEAAEDHRASSRHAPRSLYGRIVAEADRLIDAETVLRRTVQYGLAHYPELDKEAHFERMVAHLHEKYAEGGYLHLWIPESANAARLSQLRAIIDCPAELRTYFERFYAEETLKK